MKRKNKIKIGTKIPIGNTYLKVMAYADNYYMVRYKGAYPFINYDKQLEAVLRLNTNHKNEQDPILDDSHAEEMIQDQLDKY